MNVLLDTCTFLWIVFEPAKLSKTAVQVFRDPANRCLLSTVSDWEIGVQASLGRLTFQQPLETLIPVLRSQHSIDSLPLSEAAALHVVKLPSIHKDPFDRMLVSQALVHDLAIMTPDQYIHQYPVKSIW